MNFKEASELKQKNHHLVGQLYKGSAIEDLVIAPTEPDAWEGFIKSYVYSDFNGTQAVLPYSHMNLDVVAFFNRAYIDRGFMFFTSIDSLRQELQVL